MTHTAAATAPTSTLTSMALATLAAMLALAVPLTVDLFGPPLALGLFA